MIGSLVAIFIFYFLLMRLSTIVLIGEINEYNMVMFGTSDPAILTLMVLLAIVFCFFFAKWISKKYGSTNFAMSTQFLWMVLAVLTSFTFKGISYAFTIPAIISLLLIIPIIFKANWAIGCLSIFSSCRMDSSKYFITGDNYVFDVCGTNNYYRTCISQSNGNHYIPNSSNSELVNG